VVSVWRNTLPDEFAALAEMVLRASADAKRDPYQFRNRIPQERVNPKNHTRKVVEQRPRIFFARLCVSARLGQLGRKPSAGAEFRSNSCVIDVPAFQNVSKGSGTA